MSTRNLGRPKKSDLSRKEQLRIAKRKSREKNAKLGLKEYTLLMRESDYYAFQFLCSSYDLSSVYMMSFLVSSAVKATGKEEKLKKVKDAGYTLNQIIKARRR